MDLEMADRFGQVDGQTYRWTDKLMDRQTDGWTVGCTNGWTDKHTLLQRCVDASKEKMVANTEIHHFQESMMDIWTDGRT